MRLYENYSQIGKIKTYWFALTVTYNWWLDVVFRHPSTNGVIGFRVSAVKDYQYYDPQLLVALLAIA